MFLSAFFSSKMVVSMLVIMMSVLCQNNYLGVLATPLVILETGEPGNPGQMRYDSLPVHKQSLGRFPAHYTHYTIETSDPEAIRDEIYDTTPSVVPALFISDTRSS